MVDQRRSQASVQLQKYDTFAKPVLLSQPEKQRSSIQLRGESPDSAAPSEPGARKLIPGKLDLSKICSIPQREVHPTAAPAAALWPPRRPLQSSMSAADSDITDQEKLLSPGRVDLPNGTPLSWHPSDALSRKASPKAPLDGDGGTQGQITIAVAQYEQKILQGQRLRKGRFSGSSTPDVSRHPSVCSSEHVTPRENGALPSGVPCAAAEASSNGNAPKSSGFPGGSAAEDRRPNPDGSLLERLSTSDKSDPSAQQSSDLAAEADPQDAETAEATAAVSILSCPEEPGADVDRAAAPELNQARPPVAQPLQDTLLDTGDGATSPPDAAAGAGDASERLQAADTAHAAEVVHQDADLPPESPSASLSLAEPEPRCRSQQDAASSQEPPESNFASPAVAVESSEAPRSSGGAGEPDQAASSSSNAGSKPSLGEATPTEPRLLRECDSGQDLSVEGVREPEWVAAFRRVVSLAVNTPLSLSPAPRGVASSEAGRSSDGVPSPPELAPSPSSEVGSSGNLRTGASSGPFMRGSGGRNLNTAFESALIDGRRKRLRADSSAHGSGSAVRAVAAVQRAAEQATLDRNDYSGARISQEAASVLSPGAIALVNGRTAHSQAELQAQLSEVVHQLRFCLASMSEQQRPLLHATDILQAAKVPRKDLAEAAEKLQEAERLRRWSEVAQSENIARLLGILGEMQAVQEARAEDVHFSAPVWLKLLGNTPLQGTLAVSGTAGMTGNCSVERGES